MYPTYWALFLGLVLFPLTRVAGQAADFDALEKEVYSLNNQFKYKESQKLLLPVLQSDTFTPEAKYQAAILLSYTYKRVLDYQSAFRFLQTARLLADKTDQKEQHLAEVLGQEAFVYFDIHNYRRADQLMTLLETTGYRHLDLEDRAKLLMQRGYLLFLNRRYIQAEETYNKAIKWLRQASPCDLPMIYVKKMQLHAATNRMDRLRQDLQLAERTADSCGIIKYRIYAREELLAIYKQRNDVAGIAATTRKVDSLNKVYAYAEHLVALHDQKEALLLAEKDRELAQEERTGSFLRAELGAAVLLVLGLLTWLLRYRRQQRRMREAFDRTKTELESYLTLSQPPPVSKPVPTLAAASLDLLSERQQEVLAFMAEGLSNREIADRLFISENTVKYHIRNIYQLLEIKDRKELLLTLKR